MKSWSVTQRWNLALLIIACLCYIVLIFSTPQAASPSTSHIPMLVLLVLRLTIIGLLLLSWIFGFYAWLQLDRYTQRQDNPTNRRALAQIAKGIWFLVAGLVVSSLISGTKPFYASNPDLTALVTQVNYYIIILFPFLGFLWLRIGSRHLSVLSETAMTTRNKIITIGPPVVLLAVFYIFLTATNTAPDTSNLLSGPARPFVLVLSTVLVIGSWILGLLAALNIERATHRDESAEENRPLIKLYNGVLTITSGFIILDALMSLGNSRLRDLPISLTITLIYIFIGIVALGFFIVAIAARQLATNPHPKVRQAP